MSRGLSSRAKMLLLPDTACSGPAVPPPMIRIAVRKAAFDAVAAKPRPVRRRLFR
jgi:hypothetical protein